MSNIVKMFDIRIVLFFEVVKRFCKSLFTVDDLKNRFTFYVFSFLLLEIRCYSKSSDSPANWDVD